MQREVLFFDSAALFASKRSKGEPGLPSFGGGPGRCIIGELTGAGGAAVVAGGIASLFCGDQSFAQFAAQAVAAGLAAHAMAGPVGCPLLPDSGIRRWAAMAAGESDDEDEGDLSGGTADVTRSLGSGATPRQLVARLVGASAVALLTWFVFPPCLDFQLVVSSILVSGGTLGASILADPAEEGTPQHAPRMEERSKGAPSAEKMGIPAGVDRETEMQV